MQVDIDRPDLERFPGFAALQHRDCVLEVGDLLFIPCGWWHYVKALPPQGPPTAGQLRASFSVSFWF